MGALAPPSVTILGPRPPPPHAHEACSDLSPNASSAVSVPQMQAMLAQAPEPRTCVRPYPRTQGPFGGTAGTNGPAGGVGRQERTMPE